MNFSGDLKVINILAGVMGNSSTHPCYACTVHKKDLCTTSGQPRTLGSIKHFTEQWLASGGKEKNAKDYFNCINRPLLFGNDCTKVLDVCPPPSLHLLLGLMNSAYDNLAKTSPTVAEAWARAANVTRHAQFGFVGRHCRALLAKQDVLNEAGLEEFALMIQNLALVIEKCFGMDLVDGYPQAINEFCDSWIALELPVTPKFHIMKFHVAEFCASANKGLGQFSEQTIEAIHQNFTKTWMNYKLPETHKDYEKNILKAVVEYNSSHI